MAKLKKSDAIAIDGQAGVYVGSWTSRLYGMVPHVQLTVSPIKSGEGGRQAVKLTSSEARRVAIAILEAAEKADKADNKSASDTTKTSKPVQ